MRIATHPVHTGYDFEFAKTGQQFFAMKGTWNDKHRPKPDNWHLIGDPDGPYDLAVVGSYAGFQQIRHAPCPVIFNLLADGSARAFPRDIEARVSHVCFLGKEVAERWPLQDPSKRRIIELGADVERFSGYTGARWRVLTVGSFIPTRWEKGYMQLRGVSHHLPVDIVGAGNDGMSGAIGEVPLDDLLARYQGTRVYFNPGAVIGISVVEAMAVGMPVVTFRPINLRDLFMDGVNGFVVDTVDEAVDRIKMLLADASLAQRIGHEARETAKTRLSMDRFIRQWNELFQEAVMQHV